MSLMPHTNLPRSMLDMDNWMQQQMDTMGNQSNFNSLDMFDPFDELDHTISRNLQWLNKPEFMQQFPLMPKVPQKYRITVECHGYTPQSIKTEIKGNQLFVYGNQKDEQDQGQFNHMEFKKCYTIPERCELDKMVSFMAHGHLVVEFPLKEAALHMNADLFPEIVESKDGQKMVQMKFAVPENIHPERIHVNVKDRDIIVKAQEQHTGKDTKSKFHYYKRTTMPENTDFKNLKCNYDNHQISIEAPINTEFKSYKNIPIQMTQQQQQMPAINAKKQK